MGSPLIQTFTSHDDREGLFSRVLTKLNSLWVAATYPFAGTGRNFSFHYASEVSRALSPHFRIGDRVEIGKHTWFHTWCARCTKNNHDVTITIEEDCRLGPRSTISAENSVHLERAVILESDVLLMDHAHAYQDVSRSIFDQGATPGGKIRIEEGCRIGRGATVLCDRGELVLGRNCVVAPGAVVSRSFPAGSTLSGNPARAIRQEDLSRVHADLKESSTSHSAGENARLKHVEEASRTTEEDSEEAGSGHVPESVSEDLLSWFSRGVGKLRTLWLRYTYGFAAFGKGAWAHYSFKVDRGAAKYISLGEKVGFGRDARVEIDAIPGTKSPVVIFERGSGMQRRCLISARNRVHVMENVMFGPSVLVADHSVVGDGGGNPAGQVPVSRGGTVRIEAECWIGFGAVIICEQGDLVIGKHSVIGANSVITRSIPPYSIVAGTPARIVKQYDFSQKKWVLGCIRPATSAGREQSELVVSALS